MRILQIAPQVPFPLLDGGKVGIFNITKHVAQRGHEITLVAFERTGDSEVGPLPQFCELVSVPHSVRNSPWMALRNLASDLPYNISKYYSDEMKALVTKIVRSKQFDIVHVDHLHMAHYGVMCKSIAGLPIVLREHNVESVIMERFAGIKHPLPVRLYLAQQLQRLRHYESELVREFDRCCVITEDDKTRLEHLQPLARADVIPAGVEAGYFAGEANDQSLPFSISFFGGFDWLPNEDAVVWFKDFIFPTILAKYPSSKLFLIGKRPSKRILALESEQIHICGFVPDLAEEIRRYDVTIAPFRIGGGMRLKILESFAMRVPVVATSIGCEGIAARDNEHLLIADDPLQFAQAVITLFENRELRIKLTERAHALATARYTWEHVAEEFERVYDEVLARKRDGKGVT